MTSQTLYFYFQILEMIKTINIEKKQAKKNIDEYWTVQRKLQLHVAEKSTLAFLNLQGQPTKTPHIEWQASKHSQNASYKAIIKAKLLTDTYRLQYNRSKYNQYTVSQECLLCSEGSEDRQHFIHIVNCPALRERRKPYIAKLSSILEGELDGPKSMEYLADGGVVTQLLLDPTRYTLAKETQAEIENLNRNMLYALHCSRANKLRQLENN